MAGEQAGRQEPDPGMELRYELLANLMGSVGVVFFSGSSDLSAGSQFFQ